MLYNIIGDIPMEENYNIEYTSFEEIAELESIIGEDRYDLYRYSDNCFWLGSDGRIYEFEYFPDEEPKKVFENWEDFNEKYPY